MRVTYNALVQKDVNRILKRYDNISTRLGDEFWSELTAKIEATAQNQGHSHPAVGDFRRVNLKRFPYHFLFLYSDGFPREYGSRSSDITNGTRTMG